MNHKVKKDILILGIETSCDDTSIAIARNDEILTNIVANQKVHVEYGGVVPELASREHLKNILPTISLALQKSKINMNDIDAIAFTRGPGLMGSLLVGTSFAKSLSLSLNKPLIEVNHMEAHVLANCIDHSPTFPFICLTVSGGHTQIVLVNSVSDIQLIGETLDDSAGETFDKCAKLLGLNYPGGPEIEKAAINGDKTKFNFPTPKVDGLNFSFSGLKTSFKNFINKQSPDFIKDNLHDICASLQSTIIEILIDKIIMAKNIHKVNDFVVCGGVSANSFLRKKLKEIEKINRIKTYVPKINYSTDNAAMIGINGYFKFKDSKFGEFSDYSLSKYKV